MIFAGKLLKIFSSLCIGALMAGKSILLRDPNFSRILDNMLQKRLYHYKLCLQILIFSLLKTTQLNKT